MKNFMAMCLVAMMSACGGLGLEPMKKAPPTSLSQDVASYPDSMSGDDTTDGDTMNSDDGSTDAVDCPMQDNGTDDTMAADTTPPADMGQQDTGMAMCQSDAECDDGDINTPNFCWPGSLGSDEFGCTSAPPIGKMYKVCVSTPTNAVVQLMYNWIPGMKSGNISSGDANATTPYCISIPMNQLCQDDDFGLKLAVATPVTGGPWVWWCGKAVDAPSKATVTVTIDGVKVVGELVKEDQACDGSNGVGEGNWWAKKPAFCE